MSSSDIHTSSTKIEFLAGTDIFHAKLQAAKLAIDRNEIVSFKFNDTYYYISPRDIAAAFRLGIDIP